MLTQDTRKGWELPAGLFQLRSAAASLPDIDSEYYKRFPEDGSHSSATYANFRNGLSVISRNRPCYSPTDLAEAFRHLNKAIMFWRGVLARNTPPTRCRNDWAWSAETGIKRCEEAKSILAYAARRAA